MDLRVCVGGLSRAEHALAKRTRLGRYFPAPLVCVRSCLCANLHVDKSTCIRLEKRCLLLFAFLLVAKHLTLPCRCSHP